MRGGENKGMRSRLAFLGTLATGLAHEIKNPLSAMSVNLQMLREDLENSESPRDQRLLKRVGVLEREVSRLERILEGFLRFARGYQLRPAPQSVNALLREVVEFWAAKAATAGVDVQLVLEPDLPDVPIDATYFKQALLNLLNNAFEALTQRPDAEKTGREQILVCSRRTRAGLDVLVIDNGPGIAADVLEHVFDPYFSTKPGGSGLGLPTARRIIEEMGGALTCESEPGRGSSFRIALRESPAKPERAAASAQQPSASDSSAPASEKERG